ncbi:hypothetical protein HZS_6548, partial [Henneguya salminicola]
IGTLVEFTCDKIFSKFVDNLLLRPVGYELDQDLHKHITLLLVKFNSERKRVQRASDKYLSILMNKFPHMLWNSSVIRTMLDFMHILKITSNQMQSGCISISIDVPHSNIRYTLPDTKEKRDYIISDYQSRCDSLINEAARCAPTVICSILLDYLVENRLSFIDINTHFGIELLMSSIISWDINSAQNIDYEEANANGPSSTTDTLTRIKKGQSKTYLVEQKLRNFDSRGFVSTCTYTATSRSHYLGKIDGILTSQKSEMEDNVKLYPEFEKKLIERLIEKNTMSESELADFVMLCTSYMCVTKRFIRKIIYQLCNLPVSNFTLDSIKLAIESWEWIFTSFKYHQVSLMSAICLAFEATFLKKMGIFDFSSKQTSDNNKHSAPAHVHRVWIEFLMDRFDIVKFYSPPQVKILSRVVGQSLKILLNASLDQEYFDINSAPFLKLNCFGLKLLQRKFLSNVFCRIELREKIFKTIFLYFSSNFTWPNIETTKDLLEIFNSIIKLLSSDRKFQNMDDADIMYQATELRKDSITLTASFYNSKNPLSENSKNFRSGTLVLRRSHNSVTKISERNSLQDSISTGTFPTSNLTVSDSKSYNNLGYIPLVSEDIAILRSTLIHLCGREIDRLLTWSNPTDNSEIYSKFTKNIKTTFCDKKYNRKIKLIWQINPNAAMMLTKRFLDIPCLHKDICYAVRKHPARVLSIPSAVNLFWSSDQCVALLPDCVKSLILLWARCPMSIALEFLSPHSHSISIYATQYAISCFKCSSIDQILFYIPQLVQCLRNDQWLYVKDYVLWISQKNNIISHQFIWNMQTNAYLDEDATLLDPVIGQLLLDMVQQIKKNFNQSALNFYEREINFFDRITKISSILKYNSFPIKRPYEKSKRKKICQEELSKILPVLGVYLPTNPDSLILNIDYSSGIPMQSAAKAPFLARFEVFTVDTETVEKINLNGILLAKIQLGDSSNSQLSKLADCVSLKGAIFKVGDDVRQDMLALQIISFFKGIFKQIGLDLYLYPYKVVATSPGARESFTKSLAAYSVVSYILQVKDRHNGNIMINNEGCIIHIDFGFLFESSPGGNMGFEPDMKITAEMLNILGGSTESTYFKYFIKQTIKGYLAIRPHQEEIVNIVALMLNANLPCFRGETIKRLRHLNKLYNLELA